MMTLSLWLIDMGQPPESSALPHRGVGRRTRAGQDHGHLPLPPSSVQFLGQLPGPHSCLAPPNHCTPSSIVGLFQTCPLCRAPLAQRAAPPFQLRGQQLGGEAVLGRTWRDLCAGSQCGAVMDGERGLGLGSLAEGSPCGHGSRGCLPAAAWEGARASCLPWSGPQLDLRLWSPLCPSPHSEGVSSFRGPGRSALLLRLRLCRHEMSGREALRGIWRPWPGTVGQHRPDALRISCVPLNPRLPAPQRLGPWRTHSSVRDGPLLPPAAPKSLILVSFFQPAPRSEPCLVLFPSKHIGCTLG